MTRKKTKQDAGDAAAVTDAVDHVYTAHQVHTLAQLLFQQLAAGWQAPIGWMSGGPYVRPPIGQVAPEPLNYWYP